MELVNGDARGHTYPLGYLGDVTVTGQPTERRDAVSAEQDVHGELVGALLCGRGALPIICVLVVEFPVGR